MSLDPNGRWMTDPAKIRQVKRHSPLYLWFLGIRRARKGVKIGISVTALVLVLGGIFSVHAFTPSTSQQLPPAVQVQAAVVPTDLQAFINAHGPWLTTEQSLLLREKADVRNLALFQSNGLLYSTQTVVYTNKWEKVSPPPQVTGLTVTGTVVQIRTQKGEVYTLNVTQPFMVEGDLVQIFVVDQKGEILAIPISQATFTERSADSEITLPMNPNLSVSIGS